MAQLFDHRADDATVDGVIFGPQNPERGVVADRLRHRFGDRRRRCRIVPDGEGEDAARGGGTDDGDFAAEQGGQVPGDGQAEAGAAVDARHRAIDLAEGFEDDLLLIGGDAGAGV